MNLSIIGGGSWGTALAFVLAPRFDAVRLWVYEQDLAGRMARTRENDVYLPGFRLPDSVEITGDARRAAEGAGILLGVMPSHYARRMYQEVRPSLSPETILVSATKGIETGTLLRMSEVVGQVTGRERVAVLSGPTFAREVARGDPTAVVVASSVPALAAEVQAAFSGPAFRLYTSDDPVGVELAAALKNVIAIAAGICQGLGLGNNTLAALIARGLAEITRLAVAMGGETRTLSGLAGLGDLVLTCTGELSRNRRVGLELAKGRPLAEIVASMRMVAEGIETCQAAVDLAERHSVEMPITRRMYAILRQGKPPREAVRELMERSLKGE